MSPIVALAREFSPRYEVHRADLVTIDISGLGRLLGDARAIGEELQRDASARGLRVHVAIAGTRTAAMVLALRHAQGEAERSRSFAHARPELTLVEPGEEADALAPLPIGLFEKIAESFQAAAPAAMPAGASAKRDAHARHQRAGVGPREKVKNVDALPESSPVSVFKSWGLRTLGELAALPAADLAARLGRQGLVWQAIARGVDTRPLVPTPDEERFESSLDLEWPIEGLEPLSFVLTRLLEPLSTRLERRDRGVAVLHIELRLAGTGLGTCSSRNPSPPIHTRSLQLPTPIRDVRTLRTLALLDFESHPPGAAVDRVTIRIDPTPGRVLQHALFTRAHPTPEQLSTLLARLGALMGQDRLGAPALVDSFRSGAFEMRAFATDERPSTFFMARGAPPPLARAAGAALEPRLSRSGEGCRSLASALRRYRQPVPARVAIEHGAPVRVTTDRRGFAGGTVVTCAGPWRTSGEWWASQAGKAGDQPIPPRAWNRDEWDVALSDGAVYRIFQDRDTDGWFIDAIVD